MATEVRSRVNQQGLARELGVSDSCVRQMVDSYILPQPHHDDGGYDLALRRERYDLYRNGSPDDCNEFFDETIDLAKETEKVVDRALSDEGTLADTKFASQRTQNDFARMQFITACRSQSQEERNFFHPLWRREEDRILGGLLYRSMELMGANRIVDKDGTVLATLPIYPDVQKAPASRKTPSRRARRAAVAETKRAP